MTTSSTIPTLDIALIDKNTSIQLVCSKEGNTVRIEVDEGDGLVWVGDAQLLGHVLLEWDALKREKARKSPS